MAALVGKDCKVAIGTAAVVGIGTWNWSGINSAELDATSFGDEWNRFEFGIKDGGSITFNGFRDVTDTTGQEVLKQNQINSTDMTTLRLYVNNTSYYEPCQTTGYFSPSITSGAATERSHVNISSVGESADKGGLVSVDFTARVTGCMVLV